MSAESNDLGRFLRSRRNQLRPADTGPSPSPARRVPGLRREEIAARAGISPAYYVRLEQGHSRHPSAQVVRALAQALELRPEEERHLESLAEGPSRQRERPSHPAEPEAVRPQLVRMLEHHLDTPAFILGRAMTVLAANHCAQELHPSFAPGHNIVRDVFLDPLAMGAYPDLPHVQRNAVGSLRRAVGRSLAEPELDALVEELSTRSDAFRAVWARHEVREKIAGTKRFTHARFGELEFDYDAFQLAEDDLTQLIVYHAEPGTAAARWLATVQERHRPRTTAGVAAGEL